MNARAAVAALRRTGFHVEQSGQGAAWRAVVWEPRPGVDVVAIRRSVHCAPGAFTVNATVGGRADGGGTLAMETEEERLLEQFACFVRALGDAAAASHPTASIAGRETLSVGDVRAVLDRAGGDSLPVAVSATLANRFRYMAAIEADVFYHGPDAGAALAGTPAGVVLGLHREDCSSPNDPPDPRWGGWERAPDGGCCAVHQTVPLIGRACSECRGDFDRFDCTNCRGDGWLYWCVACKQRPPVGVDPHGRYIEPGGGLPNGPTHDLAAARAETCACRVCGCTDEDCSGCIERTGVPCCWVEPDLCSACAAGVRP